MYTTPVVGPGTYIVAAGTDRDGDSNICDIEDACGLALEPVTITESGEGVTNVDLLLTVAVVGCGDSGGGNASEACSGPLCEASNASRTACEAGFNQCAQTGVNIEECFAGAAIICGEI